VKCDLLYVLSFTRVAGLAASPPAPVNAREDSASHDSDLEVIIDGTVILLVGPPRAGKTSIAGAIQEQKRAAHICRFDQMKPATRFGVRRGCE